MMGRMMAILPHHFHEKKETRWLLKTNKISNFMTKEATTLLLALVASSAGPMQRLVCSFLPGDASIGGMMAVLPHHFHEKKETTRWPLKTNKISNFMTQEASTPFLAVVARSLACVAWRWNPSAISANVNVGGMAAILPAPTIMVRC
jgi:hypothetical protein